MKRKSIYLKLATVFVLSSFLYSCGTTSNTQTTSETATTTEVKASIIGDKSIQSVIDEIVTYDDDDNYTDWKNENPNYIKLNGSSATIEGSGAEVTNNKITITSAGTYIVSGNLDDGQIIVDSQDKGTVRLVLNGTQINSSNNAPIYSKQAGKTIISLEEGTENSIIDGEKYVYDDSSTDEPNAAIFSKDNLIINGTGKLTVKGNYNNGITSKDDLKILSGNIEITSTDDGLLGRDLLAINDGNITINANGDALRSTNDTDSNKGIIAVEGGTFNLTSKTDGIQAETAVLITNGTFNINSGGGNTNGAVKTNNDMKGGKFGGNTDTPSTETATEAESSKAIKALADIGIAGGTFNIDSADDSMHSNNNVTITGGNINIASGDDGIHGDSTITTSGGKINITKSYEGIESSVITISDGEIHVTASDDALNASGGADGSSTNGRPGQNSFTSSGDGKLNINGGYIVVNSTGDGLDSNGSISMTKGTVIVSGPTNNGNGSLDYDGTFEMTGGLLVSAGSSGMAQGPSDTSTQNAIVMTYPQTQSAGTIVNLQDNSGNILATFAPEKDYQTVVISSPDLKKDGTYTLYSGGKSTGSLSYGLYTNGKYEGGTKIVSFTISNAVTWLNESGVTTANSGERGGQKGGQRGGQKPDNFGDDSAPTSDSQKSNQ